jgi:hypothetical protein
MTVKSTIVWVATVARFDMLSVGSEECKPKRNQQQVGDKQLPPKLQRTAFELHGVTTLKMVCFPPLKSLF